MLKRLREQSFTLLEMLIVIGIIAIVLSLASVSYSNAQKKSHDSRRKSDLKAVQSSMEQYYSICGFQYPARAAGVNIIPSSIICNNSPTTIILQTAPVDPKTITPYDMPVGDGTQYQVCATLESESGQFCVSNQQ